MEDIIYLLLFTYPGALVQIFNNKFLPEYTSSKESNVTLAACSYFIDSCMILAVSLTIYRLLEQQQINGLGELIASLQHGWAAALYGIISLPVSVAYAASKNLLMRLVNKSRMDTSTVSTWGDMVERLKNPKQNFLEYPIVAIRKEGKLIVAGVPRNYSSDGCTPQDMLLEHCEQVELILNNPDWGKEYVDGSVATYVNIKEGYEITYYSARKMYEDYFLDGEAGR